MTPLLNHDDGEEFDDRTDLVPLIDCVFLVLLFYVVVSTFADETAFPVQLPRVADSKQTSQIAKATEVLTISVAADGALAVDKTKVAPLELGRVLRERLAAARPRTIVIRGDRSAPYEKVAAALEVAQSLGIPELSLVVDKTAPAAQH